MSGLTDLPEDILLRIVSFISPLDIIRLRQVSKTLYSVTCHPVVWIHAYKSAALPRPPGPYLRPGDKEGLNFLERALVQSTKLEPWSTRDFNLHALRSPRVGDRMNRWHLSKWGSWFITQVGLSIVYRNLNSDDPQTHVLFTMDDSAICLWLAMYADTVTLAGHPITYILLKSEINTYPLTLLKIIGHFRSSLSLEAAISLSFPRYDEIRKMTASPGYVCMYYESLPKDVEFRFALFDVITEKIYHLPAFKSTSVAPEIHERLVWYHSHDCRSVNFLLTSTHILVTFPSLGPDHHIQAFNLPSSVESGAEDDGMLRMTHEGICNLVGSPTGWVLRGNTVTNVGGVQTTEIRAVIHPYGVHEYSAIDLTLTASSSPGIGTITLSQCTSLISFKVAVGLFEVGSSEDGFGRGVCCFRQSVESGVQTFSVDAGGPVCRVDVGPRRYVSMPDPSSHKEFNAWNGEVCYVDSDDIMVYKL